jgi:Periplasmic copper-binding protein (NosD)
MGTRLVAGQRGPQRLLCVTLATVSLLLASCGGPAPTQAAPPPTPTLVAASPTPTLVPGSPTPRPSPTPPSYVVTSPADSGPGTLRQAVGNAEGAAIITFDPSVFPPDAPVAIKLASDLPELGQGNLTIDASEAGVILDGRSMTAPGDHSGITITSNKNTIRGLQIIGFSNAGIALRGGAQYNMIGGDRTIGAAPLGQGNLISGPGDFGIGLWDRTTSHNTIQGNYIGISLEATESHGYARDAIHSNGATRNLITDNVIGGSQQAGVYLCCVADGENTVTNNMIGVGPDGTTDFGNRQGGVILDRSSHNVIGPGNTIAYNVDAGVLFRQDAPSNTITQNSIHDNDREGIREDAADQSAPSTPVVAGFDLQAGVLVGTTCAGCVVEVFSDISSEGAIYEGQAKADENGSFTLSKGLAFSGPRLTTTATNPAGSTSAFSRPTTGARSAVPPPPATTPTSGPHPTPSTTQVARPTVVPMPAGERVSLAEIEAALAHAGYSRAPFYDETGAEASGWTLDNPYEQFITWEDGTVRLEVLNRKSTRSDHMEQKLKLLDRLFSAEFMTELRQENETYNASVAQSVSGEPDTLYPPMPGDEWRTIWGQYNTKSVTIGSYEVTLALWFFQVTCPPGYSCWMLNFPGQEFTGDTSFVFYTIEIPLSSTP